MMGTYFDIFNGLLPQDLQVAHATKHSGRATCCTVALDNNVDPVTLSKTTKHKDLGQLKTYQHKTRSNMLATSMAIGIAAHPAVTNMVAGISMEEEEFDAKIYRPKFIDFADGDSDTELGDIALI